MTVIDPSTNLGKLRLRCADYTDIPYLPDSVYLQTLTDTANNLQESAKICATYILGMLSFKVRRKIGLQLEVFGSSQFEQYKQYLLLTVKDPAFMDLSPIPYSKADDFAPLIQFQDDWNKCYYRGVQSQQMAVDASISPNDGSLYGPLGTNFNGWQTV